MKVSVANAVCVEPTERHHSTGTPTVRRVQLDGEIGDRVGQRRRALDAGDVDAVLDHHRLERRADEDRLADDPVLPARRRCRRVEPRLQRVEIGGTVVAALHVVLARPHELDRNAGLALRRERLGDRRRLDDVVRLSGFARRPKLPPAKSWLMRHLLGLQPDGLRDRDLVGGLELLAVPDFAAVGVELHHAVQRLHRRVREIRELVVGVERLRRAGERLGRVAVVARRLARRRREPLVLGEDVAATTA